MAKYQGIEKFANFATEGHHRQNRENMAHCTSGYNRGDNHAAAQQIYYNIRRETQKSNGLLPDLEQRGTKQTWACVVLAMEDPYLQQFVVNGDFI